MLERNPVNLDVTNNRVKLGFRPFEIKIVRLVKGYKK